jgi:hypothetical protein
MRKYLVGLLSLLLLLVFSVPAVASVNISVNGNKYQPSTTPQIQEGTTLAPLYMIERIAGATVTQSGEAITIQKNNTIMRLEVGSTQATLDNDQIMLPQAPIQVNGETMLPLRAVLEGLGANVDWAGENRTVLISFEEKRDGMTPEDLLLKSTEAMAKYNSCKAVIDVSQNIQIMNPETKQVEEIDMQMAMDMAMQNDPVLIYVKTKTFSADPELGDMVTEMVINENELYMTVPGEGWVKLSMPDIQAYLKQASQDPLKSLQQSLDAGVIMSFADDQEINGKPYYVLNVTMGPECFKQLLDEVKGTLTTTFENMDESGQLEEVYEKIFTNLKADMFYSMLIDKETFVPSFMDLHTNMEIKTDISTPDETFPLDMSMQQIASCEYYGLNESFGIPDLSQAKDILDIQ